MLALVACSALLAVAPDAPPVASDNLPAYQEAKAQAGRSPEDQVRLALWCESHGLTAQRLHHLTLAILADPKNAVARGLMGMVAYDGRWVRPEVLADKLKADPDRVATLAQYETKRQKAPYTADGQWALGTWADEHGLKEQAKAHLTAVIRLDPTRESAWKKLGHKKHEGRWVTDAQLAAEKTETEAQKAADRKWKPILEKYKAMLDQPKRREEAEAALASITDPRAVSMIGIAFAKSPVTQSRAARLLGQIDSAAASKALAFLAVFAQSAEARRVATETLRLRDPRDYVGLLVALIRDPIKYEVKPVGGPGSPGVLFVEGKRANIRRVYAPPPPPDIALLPSDYVVFDADGLPVVARYGGSPFQRQSSLVTDTFTPGEYTGQVAVSADRAKLLHSAHESAGNNYGLLLEEQAAADRISKKKFWGGPITVRKTVTETDTIEIDIPIGRMILESQRVAVAAQQQLADDVRAIEDQNDAIRRFNAEARTVLLAVIGQDLGDDRKAWDRMWVDRQGYVYHETTTSPAPTIVEDVPLNYQPTTILPTISYNPLSSRSTTSASLPMPYIPHFSCFAAGTAVRTIEGDRAIESIRAGDLVLVQDTKSGGLEYQAVVTAYHNPPSSTLRIDLGAEAVVATGIHRFWLAGQGWTMSRDLKVGDQIRTLGGIAKVEGVTDDRIQPVFNLEVAEGHSFLVGKLGALVHDNSLVEATLNPFDAGTPAVAVAKVAK